MKSLLFALSLFAAPAFAGNLTPNEVRSLAGEYFNDIIENREVASLLRAELGPAGYRNFLKIMAVATPAEFLDGRFLLVGGCRQGNCAGNESFFVIDSRDSDAIMVLIQTEGKNRIIKSRTWFNTVNEYNHRELGGKVRNH